MALINAAEDLLAGHEIEHELLDIHNRLNEERLALLGNGQGKPRHVSDILEDNDDE